MPLLVTEPAQPDRRIVPRQGSLVSLPAAAHVPPRPSAAAGLAQHPTRPTPRKLASSISTPSMPARPRRRFRPVIIVAPAEHARQQSGIETPMRLGRRAAIPGLPPPSDHACRQYPVPPEDEPAQPAADPRHQPAPRRSQQPPHTPSGDCHWRPFGGDAGTGGTLQGPHAKRSRPACNVRHRPGAHKESGLRRNNRAGADLARINVVAGQGAPAMTGWRRLPKRLANMSLLPPVVGGGPSPATTLYT